MNKIRIGFIKRFLSGLLTAVCLTTWHGGPQRRLFAPEAKAATLLAAKSFVQGSARVFDPYTVADEMGHVGMGMLLGHWPAAVKLFGPNAQVRFEALLQGWPVLLIAAAGIASRFTLFAASFRAVAVGAHSLCPVLVAVASAFLLLGILHFARHFHAQLRALTSSGELIPNSDADLIWRTLRNLFGFSAHKPMTKVFYSGEKKDQDQLFLKAKELARTTGVPGIPSNLRIIAYLVSQGQQDLLRDITPEEIYSFLMEYQHDNFLFPNVKTLAILYAEMLRRLNKKWPESGPLSKANIYETLFINMLSICRLEQISALTYLFQINKETSIRQINEAACRKLFTLILCHLLAADEISYFGNERHFEFLSSSEENPYRMEPNPSGEYLSIHRVWLQKGDLSDMDLRHTKLWSANMGGADLSEADLSDANLAQANLSKTKLCHANLQRSVLQNTNLSEADLQKADLKGAALNNQTNLKQARVTQTQYQALIQSDFLIYPLTQEQRGSLTVLSDPPAAEAHSFALPALLALSYFSHLPSLLAAVAGAALLGMLYSRLSRMQAALLASGEILRRRFAAPQNDTKREKLPPARMNPLVINKSLPFDLSL